MYTIKYYDDWIEISKDGEVLYGNHYINAEDIFDILNVPYTLTYASDDEGDN